MLNTFQKLEHLAMNVEDISTQVFAYSNHLPKQARWQAELMLEDIEAKEKLNMTFEKMVRLSESFERAVAVLEQSPDLLARERIAGINALSNERVKTLEDIDRQRLLSLEWLTNERITVLEALQKERMMVLDALEKERMAALEQIESFGDRISEKIILETKHLIDHFYLRAAQLSGVIFFVVFIAVYIIFRRLKRLE